LGAVFDGFVVVRKPPGDGFAGIVGPFDDVDEFAFEEVEDAHGSASWGLERDDGVAEREDKVKVLPGISHTFSAAAHYFPGGVATL
jgi:hypothetical protein